MSNENVQAAQDLANSVIGSSPVISTATTLLTESHSIGRMFEASVAQQQLNDQVSMAATSKRIAEIFSA